MRTGIEERIKKIFFTENAYVFLTQHFPEQETLESLCNALNRLSTGKIKTSLPTMLKFIDKGVKLREIDRYHPLANLLKQTQKTNGKKGKPRTEDLLKEFFKIDNIYKKLEELLCDCKTETECCNIINQLTNNQIIVKEQTINNIIQRGIDSKEISESSHLFLFKSKERSNKRGKASFSKKLCVLFNEENIQTVFEKYFKDFSSINEIILIINKISEGLINFTEDSFIRFINKEIEAETIDSNCFINSFMPAKKYKKSLKETDQRDEHKIIEEFKVKVNCSACNAHYSMKTEVPTDMLFMLKAMRCPYCTTFATLSISGDYNGINFTKKVVDNAEVFIENDEIIDSPFEKKLTNVLS